MSILNQCPYQKNETPDTRFRAEKYFHVEKTFFVITMFVFLFVAPIVIISDIFLTHKSLLLIFLTLFASLLIAISTVFLYQLSIQRKFKDENTNQLIPLCGIFSVFKDILFRKDKLLRDFDCERKSRFGDIYLSFFGLRPIVVVTTSKLAEIISKDYDTYAKSDPRDLNMPYFHEWVGNNNVVLANGERWQEIRKLIHPAVNDVERFMPVMHEKTQLFFQQIDQIYKSGVSKIPLTRWLKALSLDIAGKSLFGFEFNHLNEKANPGIDATDYVLNEIFNPIRVSLPIINKLPTKSNKKLKNSIQLLDTLVDEMIEYYCQKYDKDNSQAENLLSLLLNGNYNKMLSKTELRNNILALVLASHETTQVSLSGVLYFLAKYPNIQEMLRKETLEIFPSVAALSIDNYKTNERKDSLYWKLKTFKNLDNFILESLRLYSPLANQNPRTTMSEVNLNGYIIPKGTLLIMNLHAIHMSDQEWEEPEKFIIERFNKGNRNHKYAHLPFGNGPRICSGREFSMIEQKLMICYLLHKYKIALPCKDYQVPLQRFSFTGVPDDTFALFFEAIDSVK